MMMACVGEVARARSLASRVSGHASLKKPQRRLDNADAAAQKPQPRDCCSERRRGREREKVYEPREKKIRSTLDERRNIRKKREGKGSRKE